MTSIDREDRPVTTSRPDTCIVPETTDTVALLRTMLLSREFDRRAGILSRQGKAWFHISAAGHEALAGAALALGPDDPIFPHYRDRALLMMRGVDVTDMTRDLVGAPRSPSGGRNMGAHFSSRPHNVFSIASPVGSQCLPAAGAAWTQQLNGTGNVVLCSLGEASTRQGEFYEALAWAVDRRLPIVFLVADNGYGISTPTSASAPVHRPVLHDTLIRRVDGVDPLAVQRATATAVTAARAGGGPTVLWCDLDRLESHTSSDDHRVYRSANDIAALRDPIELCAARLIADRLLTPDELDAMRRDIRAQVEHAATAVLDEPPHDPATVHRQLYSTAAVTPLPAERGYATIVDAVNGTLKRGLAHYPDMILFGEDIEDPKGGVFGFTKGLGTSSGGRVFNSPLAEATIVGTAVGLAATGKRPVVELQFIDFAGPAWSQITDQLATLRWRTLGDWSCPVVLYAPYGGYLPGGGIWHSQSNEALFTHIPGLRVAVVAHAHEAETAFLNAFAADDPTLILLPKHAMRVRDTERTAPGIPGTGSRLVREGTDATVVTWGNGVELAVRAAEQLAAESVSVEILDLVWLAPWDRAAVSTSLAKTGRLIVVQEDNRTSSFGATIIADLTTADQDFFSLLAPPRLVARADVHVPFHPALEAAVLPNEHHIIDAVRSTLD